MPPANATEPVGLGYRVAGQHRVEDPQADRGRPGAPAVRTDLEG
jgi:hypothetical protein